MEATATAPRLTVQVTFGVAIDGAWCRDELEGLAEDVTERFTRAMLEDMAATPWEAVVLEHELTHVSQFDGRKYLHVTAEAFPTTR